MSDYDQLNEQIMIGLRTKWGIEKAKMEAIKSGAWEQLQLGLSNVETSHFNCSEDSLLLSEKGKLVADRLASELFFD